MNKTIQINPDLFTFSTVNKTRKKRNKIDEPGKPIRIRSPRKESSKAAKNRILKYIRQHQDAKDNQMAKPIPIASSDSEFENDFENSLKYLSTIAEKTQNAIPQTIIQRHNTTLRQYPVGSVSAFSGNPMTISEVSLDLPAELSPNDPPIAIRPRTNDPLPMYGCLKNGTLPTYRMWKSQTLKAPLTPSTNPQPTIVITNPRMGEPVIIPRNNSGGAETMARRASITKHREIQKQRGRMKPMIQKKKQKRILRRTYRVGKSKHYPKVAVLVSNKTLRNQTSTKIQLLKQTPMDEVKRELIKKGLIKVGSAAPNDVLRKMYESVELVCGDIQNHNPENLLYNYFHAN